mmetsp:Transcript_27506/g.73371  ORF Transcript_27506/g.73371 Transcript_27506/m.73371 type:complete len:242 (-) Transcript_27506:179-904(-)
MGDVVGAQEFQVQPWLEGWYGNDADPEAHTEVHEDNHPVDVVEGQHRNGRVGGPVRGSAVQEHARRAELLQVGDDIRVGEHRSFGQARCAAGVRENAHVPDWINGYRCWIAADVERTELGVARRRLLGRHKYPAHRPLLEPHRLLDLLQERWSGHEVHGLRVGELVGGLGGGVHWVQRGHDAPRHDHGVERDNILDAVRHPHRNGLALPQPGLLQPPGGAPDGAQQRGVAHCSAGGAVDHL